MQLEMDSELLVKCLQILKGEPLISQVLALLHRQWTVSVQQTYYLFCCEIVIKHYKKLLSILVPLHMV